MLFMQGDECSRGPVSRCQVPRQEIILGGFGLKGSRFCVLHITLSIPHTSLLPRNLSIPQQAFTVSKLFDHYMFACCCCCVHVCERRMAHFQYNASLCVVLHPQTLCHCFWKSFHYQKDQYIVHKTKYSPTARAGIFISLPDCHWPVCQGPSWGRSTLILYFSGSQKVFFSFSFSALQYQMHSDAPSSTPPVMFQM